MLWCDYFLLGIMFNTLDPVVVVQCGDVTVETTVLVDEVVFGVAISDTC